MFSRCPWMHRSIGVVVVLLGFSGLNPQTARGQNTVYFSVNDPGVTKSVATWGVDTAWPNFDNVRQSIEHIGQGNVDIVRLPVLASEPLIHVGGDNYELNSAARSIIDTHLSLAALAGTNIPFTLGPGGTDAGSIDPMYVSGGGTNVTNFARLFKTTQQYINSQPGFTSSSTYAIEPFNEPDWNFPNANPADLNNIIQQLKTYPVFQNTWMMAGSTLNSNNAQWWYDQAPQATAGSSHLLGGSLTSYVNFMTHVKNNGEGFVNPELHSLGEAIVGAEHGMIAGMWWADALRARGLFAQASDGKRLGYAEDLGHQSAAAVYRAPDGEVYAFAGGLERFGSATSYRFVSDQDVYFNGIPAREYVIQTKFDEFFDDGTNDFSRYGSWSNQGAYADIDLDDSGVPALDGYRWKIVNALDGTVMEVVNGGTGDGALIQSAADNGGLNQLWRIIRTRNGYYQLYNANSGRTAEVAFSSLGNGADVRQWGTADNQTQQWYVEEAGDGSFYIRNGHSNQYLDADLGSSNVFQWESTGGLNQRWLFVPANPTHGPLAQYPLQGNVNDTAGAHHATAFGNPSYGTGPAGMPDGAILLDGINDYVQLPDGIVSSDDVTISAWIKWDGGGAWQRIFDFGNDTDEYMFLTPSSDQNTMRFAITTDSNAGEQVLETDALPTGEWVHLTLTLGGNTGILYIDGEPRVAGQILVNPTDFNPVNNYIGKSQWPDLLFNGAIADFQIFNYALDMAQVGTLYDDSLPPIVGDLDGDCFVGIADLNLVLGRWNSSVRDNDPADPSGDNYIGIADLNIVLGNWNLGTPPGTPSSNTTIPEPAGVLFLGLGGTMWLRRRDG